MIHWDCIPFYFHFATRVFRKYTRLAMLVLLCCQLCVPIFFAVFSLFTSTNVSKYEIRNQRNMSPFALDDNDTLLSTFFVIRNEKRNGMRAWLPMTQFTLDDKKK